MNLSEYQNGYTSLHWASQKGNADIAEFLITSGANLEAVDNVNIITIRYFSHYFTSVGTYTFSSRRFQRRIVDCGCSR